MTEVSKNCLILLMILGIGPIFLGLRAIDAHSFTLSSCPSFPDYCLAVSKSRQSIALLQRKSPLSILASFSCSTGQKCGNKRREGDRKTPEGIYFLEQKLTHGLDYTLYGNLAYTLNYPNPVDRLQGKTGYGIWLHARGKTLNPRNTKGCIALSTKNLMALSKYIQLGETPILIGEEVSVIQDRPEQEKTAHLLKEHVRQWALAWEEMSERYFTFYDPPSFQKTSDESFEVFQKRKTDIFQKYQWIDVYLDNIRILPASNYWVTYFGQYFRSPHFSSQGIKRLYWQKSQGKWKIVGQEWNDHQDVLREHYLADSKEKMKKWLLHWKKAWEAADLALYRSFYHQDARQNSRQGVSHIASFKRRLWQQERPKDIVLDDITILMHPRGFEINFLQTYHGRRGYSDNGHKELITQPQGDGFVIVSEMWNSISEN